MKSNKAEAKLPIQQLAILSICRFAEPVALTGVFPYMPEMIESFNVPKDEVAKWAGLTSAAFSISQCLTSMFWVRASDHYGRKPVILLSLCCLLVTTILYGFSQNLAWALIARTLAGASNGNVGIIRTTVAELVPQKELQPQAFSVMPLVWSIGSIFGPILGGALASPAKRYLSLFGKNEFLLRFPFALPNLVAAVLFCVGVTTGVLFLRETLESRKHQKDYGLILGSYLKRSLKRRRKTSWQDRDEQGSPLLKAPHTPAQKPVRGTYREVFSGQSLVNLITYSLLSLHAVAYDQLIPVFMHLPPEKHYPFTGPKLSWIKFAGGFGLDSGPIGRVFTIYGIFCMVTQFLLFPPLARRYGCLPCLRIATLAFPIAYCLTPFTVLLPTNNTRQIAIFCVMVIKGFAGVFAYPCTTILMTNSASSIPVLGMLNGVAVSVSAIGRALGPWVSGTAMTWGVERGYVVIPWWILAVFAMGGYVSTWWLIETDGIKRETAGAEEEEGIPLVGTGEGGEAVGDLTDELRRKSFAKEEEDLELALLANDVEVMGEGDASRTSGRAGHLVPAGDPPARMRSPMRSRGDAEGGGRKLH